MENLPRQSLRELVAKHGKAVCDDPRRCEALLRDACGTHKRELNILMNALRERVPSDLLTGDPRLPQDILLSRALMRGYGYTPYFVEGDDPTTMHQLMAATLNTVTAEKFPQQTAPGAVHGVDDETKWRSAQAIPVDQPAQCFQIRCAHVERMDQIAARRKGRNAIA